MATALLSGFNYLFSGVRVRVFGSLSRREVHPSSPVLLTRSGPLGRAAISRVFPTQHAPAHSEFENVLPLFQRHTPNHSLYRTELPPARCPERHFGGNQLPDGSIGLSPLHPGRTIDLNVRTA